MLNEKKIRYMTKAAVYETGAEKKNIEICSFSRADYLGLQMLKSAAAYTISFGILAGLWAGGDIEGLMIELSHEAYVANLLKMTAVLYGSGLLIYEIITYVYFSWKYQGARKSVAKYNKHLKHIHEFYRAQESAESSVAAQKKTDGEKTL